MTGAKSARVACLLAALLDVTSTATVRGAAQPSFHYTVTVTQPHTHVFQVRMAIDGLDRSEVDVSMPVWTPGSYLVREYERHVIAFTPQDERGQPLAWHKIDKNTWRIAAGDARRILLDYEVYAREPGIRWSFLYDQGGHVIGPSLYMPVVGAADAPAAARFHLPEGWRLNGALAPAADDPYLVSAPSYHELIDAPMLIGHFDEIEFEVDGVEHIIAVLGPNNADLERLRDDFIRIIRECAELFDGLPYERYALIFVTVTSGGGIEHANGTTIGLEGFDFQSERWYARVLGVTAHEYFHAWLVKRIQPPAFRPYDYEGENYTDALWFYEGFTSFYSDRLLYRAGLRSELPDPLDFVTRYRSTPGYEVQSAADASFNAWIHYYREDESTDNYRVDYYFKGNLIANLLTLEIARRTAGAKSLDDVIRLMWTRTLEQGATFASADIRAVCEEVAGGSLEEFFDRYVFGTDDIPFEDFYRLAGYDLVVDEAATREANATGYMGVTFSDPNGRVRLNSVVRGGPAWRAGLNYGDVITALDGTAVTDVGSFLQLLGLTAPGQEIELDVWRLGQAKTIKMTLGARPVPTYRLLEVDEPTAAQLAVRRVWRETAPGN